MPANVNMFSQLGSHHCNAALLSFTYRHACFATERLGSMWSVTQPHLTPVQSPRPSPVYASTLPYRCAKKRTSPNGQSCLPPSTQVLYRNTPSAPSKKPINVPGPRRPPPPPPFRELPASSTYACSSLSSNAGGGQRPELGRQQASQNCAPLNFFLRGGACVPRTACRERQPLRTYGAASSAKARRHPQQLPFIASSSGTI